MKAAAAQGTADARMTAAGTAPAGTPSWQLDALWRLRGFVFAAGANDVRRRFRRTRAGLFHLLVQPVLMAVALAFVFGRLFERDFVSFLPFVLSGTVVWEMLTGACMAGAHSIIGSEGYVRHYPLPFALYPLRAMAVPLAQGAIGMALVVGWVAATGHGSIPLAWLALPLVLLLIVALATALAVTCAVAAVNVRDVVPMLAAAFPVIWLMSPISIPPEAFVKARAGFLVEANPVHHVVECLRAPLLAGQWPPASSLAVTLLCTVLAFAAATALLATGGRRLVYRL